MIIRVKRAIKIKKMLVMLVMLERLGLYEFPDYEK